MSDESPNTSADRDDLSADRSDDRDEPVTTTDPGEESSEADDEPVADAPEGAGESPADAEEPRADAEESRSDAEESRSDAETSPVAEDAPFDAEASPDDDAGASDDATGAQPSVPDADAASGGDDAPDVPPDVQKYARFKKMDGAQYDRVNEFLRERTYVTAREWAIARLCADFRTETGVEMTKIGENLPELVPFMTDTYTPQAVNQARSSFEEKVRKAGATFLYGAMCDFFTAEELDDVMYEATEVAKFLLEVEGVDLTVEEELDAEDRISAVMRDVRESSAELRHDHSECPECGHDLTADD